MRYSLCAGSKGTYDIFTFWMSSLYWGIGHTEVHTTELTKVVSWLHEAMACFKFSAEKPENEFFSVH